MRSSDRGADANFRRLTDLRNGLLQLHKTLMESERSIYERDIERVTSSNHMLSLLLHDPWFAWLRELSELVVVIDETLDARDPATDDDAARLIDLSRRLLLPEETGTGFAKGYFEALQRDPDVVLAHAQMMKIFVALG